jgi:hypothetical protein
MRKILLRLLFTTLLATVTLTVPQSVVAAPPTLDEYAACPGFSVTVESTDGTQETRVSRLRDGVIYTVVAGRGTTITVTKAGTDQSVTFGTKGSVTRTAQDTTTGDIEWALSGANLVLLFDKVDVGGPSTVLYTGLVRFTSDRKGTLDEAIQQESGTQRDICAELS